MMKKFLATLMCLIVLSAVVAIPAGAQTRYRQRAVQNSRYEHVYRDDRSFWEKHRDKITTAGGVVGGAILGRIIGGKMGAAIGAIAGGGGAAVYTYKIRNKNRRY